MGRISKRKQHLKLLGHKGGAMNKVQRQMKSSIGIEIKAEEDQLIPSTTSTPSSSSPSCCLICQSKSNTEYLQTSGLSSEDYSILLGSILGCPRKLLDSYVNIFGAPQNWIPLCSVCLDLIIETRQIKEQISNLEKELTGCQQLIISKVVSSYDDIINGESSVPELNEVAQALEAIRKYVHSCSKAKALLKVPAVDKKRTIMKKVYQNERGSSSGQTASTTSASKPRLQAGSVNFDDDEEEEEEAPMDIDELNSNNFKSNPLQIAVGCGGLQSQIFFCGLCDDFNEYASEELLTAHQYETHGPGPPIELPNESASNLKPNKEESETKAEDDETLLQAQNQCYRYYCPSCPDVRIYSGTRYAQHLAIHMRRPYKCSECLQLLPKEEDLRLQHWNDKHLDKDRPPDEKFIEMKFDPGEIYKCEGCHDGFFTAEDKLHHKIECERYREKRRRKEIQNEEIKCFTCSKIYPNRDEWRFHRTLAHPEVDSISCPFCDETFAGKINDSETILRNDFKLLEHLKDSHTQDTTKEDRLINEECEFCGVVFIGGSLTKKDHFQNRHGIPKEEAFRCRICQKIYMHANTVREHMAKHHFLSEIRICDICGQQFNESAHLSHHRLVIHDVAPEGKQIFNCPEEGCSYKSVIKAKVTEHFRSVHKHKTERPYKCKICEKSFKNSTHLRCHEKIHENKDSKPFKCDICGNSFAVKNYLYIHKRLSHEKRIFPSTNKKKPPRPKKQKDGGEMAKGEDKAESS